MDTSKKKPDFVALVVDDDPIYISFLRRIFGDMGIDDVKFLDDPLVAKELIKECSFGVLISDVIMPHMKGYDLARFAKEICPECVIVLTTAYSSNLSRFNLESYDFHLLHKPYTNLEELKKFIAHMVNGDTSFDDISDDSFSENEEYPEVLEWKL